MNSEAAADTGRLADQSPLARNRAPLHGRGRRAPARHHPRSSIRSLGSWPEKLWRYAARKAVRQRARRADREPGDAAGQGGPRCDLSVRLAGGGRCESLRPDVPRSVAVSGRLGAGGGPAHQQHAAPRRRDPSRRGRRFDRLVQADRRRRRGRLWRGAERVRADEADDRGRRCRRALRGSAVVGQEVRPHGRQGAGADAGGRRQAGRRAAGRRRLRRAHRAAGAHRRRSGDADHLRCR